MQLSQPFNATQYDPRQGGNVHLFPLADYFLEIVKTEPVETKDSTDGARKGFLEIHLKCLQGAHAGFIQIDRLNMFGFDEKTTAIAYSRLAAYAYIAGKPTINDTNELVGTKLIAQLGPQENNDKYSEVKVRKDLAGNPPVQGKACAPQSGGLQTQIADAAASSNAGWGNASTASTSAPWGNSSPAQDTQATQPTQPNSPADSGNAWGNNAGAANSAPAGNKPPWMS